MALAIAYDYDHEAPTVVDTPAELDAVLDVMAELGTPVLADLRIANATGPLWRVSLGVGIHGATARGTLVHTTPGEVRFAKSNPGPWGEWEPAELLHYDYLGHATEFPSDCEVPLDDVREAAHHYLATTGGRLARIDWHVPPPAYPVASTDSADTTG